MAKRNVDVRFLDYGKVEKISGDKVKQVITIKKGVTGDLAKKIVRLIKDSKIKVQASIQGDAVRVSAASATTCGVGDRAAAQGRIGSAARLQQLPRLNGGRPSVGTATSVSAGSGLLRRPSRRRQAADLRAGLDALLRKPALVHLQRVAHSRRAGNGCPRLCGAMSSMLTMLPSSARKAIGQRQVRVLHPEAVAGLFLEHEQHARIGRACSGGTSGRARAPTG